MASSPPVHAPERMAFQGSSFLRTAAMEQSKLAKQSPHTANAPGEFCEYVCGVEPSQFNLVQPINYQASIHTTPNAPPTTGARALTEEMPPRRRSPLGAFRRPLK